MVPLYSYSIMSTLELQCEILADIDGVKINSP